MDKIAQFKTFLNKLSDKNPSLVESISAGFSLCFENEEPTEEKTWGTSIENWTPELLNEQFGDSLSKTSDPEAALKNLMSLSEWFTSLSWDGAQRKAYKFMDAVDTILNGHGVEDNSEYEFQYVNMGDAYTPTVILYKGDIWLACYGDLVEYIEAENAEQSEYPEAEDTEAIDETLTEAVARKTEDEYQIHGHYEGGWEEVTSESTFKEAKARIKEYRENEPKTQFKIVKKRIKIQPKEETKK